MVVIPPCRLELLPEFVTRVVFANVEGHFVGFYSLGSRHVAIEINIRSYVYSTIIKGGTATIVRNGRATRPR